MRAPKTLVEAFLASAGRRGDAVFCRFGPRVTTWRQALASAARVAAELRARGMGRGDRVAFAMESRPELLESYLGILLSGAAAVPLNPRASAAEMEATLDDAGVRVVIADEPCAERIGSFAVYRRILAADSVHAPSAAPGDAADLPWSLPSPDDLALVLTTSGTTGRGKCAMLTHGGLAQNAAAVADAWDWTEEDELLLALPLFHMHGLGVGVNGTLVAGSAIDLVPRFEAKDVAARLAAKTSTLFFGVPTMYRRLLEVQPFSHAVRLFVSGSAPLSPETLHAFENRFGSRILERYGMTETGMLLGNRLGGPRKPGSVGVPFRGVELRIVRQDGRDVPEGGTGELLVRGPSVFRGYAGDPGATREAFAVGGWFRTGDLGARDPDGDVFLTGRAKELIITGGHNVSPREVEELLEGHPDVAEAAVVGLPDDDLGERVAAAVVTRGPVSPEQLVAWLDGRLSPYKRPRRIHVVASLPRNALGKLQREAVRGMLTAG